MPGNKTSHDTYSYMNIRKHKIPKLEDKTLKIWSAAIMASCEVNKGGFSKHKISEEHRTLLRKCRIVHL